MSRTRLPRFAGIAALLASALVGLSAAAASIDAATPPAAPDEYVAQRMGALVRDPASPVIGNPAAPVAIVEFFDYACPYCKAVQPRLEALVKADRNVKLVLKEFPILTPESMVATRVALACAKQGKYAKFHEAMMNYRGPLSEAAIMQTAKATGVNMVKLRKDMASPAIADEVIANMNLARSLRLFQTPSFIVGSHIVTGPSAAIDFPKEVAAARARGG